MTFHASQHRGPLGTVWWIEVLDWPSINVSHASHSTVGAEAALCMKRTCMYL